MSTLMKTLIILTGMPGAGKSTIAKTISKEFDIFIYDIDEHLTQEIREKTRKGKLVSDEERNEIIEATIKEVSKLLKLKDVILVIPLIREKHREKILNIPNSHLIELKADYPTLLKRMQGRKDHPVNHLYLRNFYAKYEPCKLKHFIVDAGQEANEVAKDVKRIIVSILGYTLRHK